MDDGQMAGLKHCNTINILTGLKMTFSSKVSSTLIGHCDTEEIALSLWALLPTVVQSQLNLLRTSLLRLPVSFKRMHTECSFILEQRFAEPLLHFRCWSKTEIG